MQDVADYLINRMISEAEIVVFLLLDNWTMKAIPPSKTFFLCRQDELSAYEFILPTSFQRCRGYKDIVMEHIFFMVRVKL